MLNIHKLSVGFGGEYLFEEISFRLNAGDRVGLIGKNGAGKSTLLKLLSKDMAPDTGVIASEKDLQLGFLRQDIDFVQGRTVLEEAQQAFEVIKSLELQLDEVNHQLATRTDYESDAYSAIIEDLSDLTHRYELIGGYNYQGETEKILQGLGFKRADFDKKTSDYYQLDKLSPAYKVYFNEGHLTIGDSLKKIISLVECRMSAPSLKQSSSYLL
jgi:ATP-binding cassette subfamily F protein 3